jgi:hypothetical protein
MLSLSIVNLHVSSNKKNVEFCTTMLLWRIYVADKNKTYFGLTVNCPILTGFGFSRQIFIKVSQVSNFILILSVAVELLHADRMTAAHDEANSRFSKFCERA